MVGLRTEGGETPPSFKLYFMAEIKNIHLVTDLSEKDKTLMEHAGLEHRRHSSITFKIVGYEPKKVTIQVVQGKSAAGVYHNAKRLIEVVNETFGRFFREKKILVHTVPYVESPANHVDVKWVNKKMIETKTKLKDLADDTGIDHTQLRALITDTNPRPMSQPMKALFWYYFAAKKI